MTNTEISRRLALAIGYAAEHVDVQWGAVRVFHNKCWYVFDHRDERTIFRIAARYKMFPRMRDGRWWICVLSGMNLVGVEHTCPATCIALAVIEASERGLLS